MIDQKMTIDFSACSYEVERVKESVKMTSSLSKTNKRRRTRWIANGDDVA